MNTKFGVWVLFPIYNSDFPAGFLHLYYILPIISDVDSVNLSIWLQIPVSVQKDLPKPKHEVYLRGIRPVPPCVLREDHLTRFVQV